LVALILFNRATADTKWELTQNKKWTEGLNEAGQIVSTIMKNQTRLEWHIHQ